MALQIIDARNKRPMAHAPARLYKTLDGRIVGEGHPDRRWLYKREGGPTDPDEIHEFRKRLNVVERRDPVASMVRGEMRKEALRKGVKELKAENKETVAPNKAVRRGPMSRPRKGLG